MHSILNHTGNNCFTLQFADDIVIYCRNADKLRIKKDLTESIGILNKWLNSINLNISAEKTKLVIFSRKRESQDFNIDIEGKTVTPSNEAKFLGLVMDRKLNWIPHIKYLKEKMIKATTILKWLSGIHWGSHPETLMLIYKATIRTMIEWGLPQYINASRTNLKRINTLTQTALKKCLGLMPSTPNAIVWHMSKEMNIYQRAEILANNYLAKCHSHTSHKLKTKLLYIDKLLKKSATQRYNFFLIKRWNCIKPTLGKIYHTNLPIIYEFPIQTQFIKLEINTEIGETIKLADNPNEAFIEKLSNLPPHELDIFTDGSGHKNTIGNYTNEENTKAGAAFYIPQLNKCESFSIIKEHSPETLEAIAIIEAIKFFKSSTHNSCIIISDAKHLIRKLNQANHNTQENQYITEIKFLAYRCQAIHKEILFMWCPGHQGVVNNDRVDQLARTGREEGKPIPTKLTIKEAQNIFKTAAVSNWKNDLESKAQANNNSYFKLIDDNTKLNTQWYTNYEQKPNRKTISIINRIRSNHHRTNAHLYKLSIIPEPKCNCGYEEEDLNHMIFTCPLNKEATENFMKFIQTKNLQAPHDIRALAFSNDMETLGNIAQAFASMNTQL